MRWSAEAHVCICGGLQFLRNPTTSNMASESKDVEMGGGSGAPAAGAAGDSATDRVKLKKWSAVALWSFDVGGWG